MSLQISKTTKTLPSFFMINLHKWSGLALGVVKYNIIYNYVTYALCNHKSDMPAQAHPYLCNTAT